jgi:hypothetical protein
VWTGGALMGRAFCHPAAAAAAALAAGALALLAAAPARAAATLIIDNADPAGQGLNDPTPFQPVGGNNATTLGAARLAVFQQAAALWGAQLSSPIAIHVTAQFMALPCNSTSAVLASTGANTFHRNFANAPFFNTWYPQALANALAGTDLDPTTTDISTEFNSGIGAASCLANASWYLGFDGNVGPGQIEMLTVLLHELSHGLGFMTVENVSTGSELNGFPDVFLQRIRELGVSPSALPDMTDAARAAANVSDPDLYWSGGNVEAAASTLTAGLISGHVRLHAPATVQNGSSVSHYSTALTPNELMEPIYTGPNHNLTLTVDLLRDIGWPVPAPAVPAAPASVVAVLAGVLALAAARRLRRGSSRCVR